MRKFYVIVDTDNPNIVEDEDPAVALACWIDAVMHDAEPVTVYDSLEDLNADHVLDALAGTSSEESAT